MSNKNFRYNDITLQNYYYINCSSLLLENIIYPHRCYDNEDLIHDVPLRQRSLINVT